MKLNKILFVFILFSTYGYASIPPGDTQGKISAVKVLDVVDGNNSFRVYFSTINNDRFQCIQNDGYITVRENGINITAGSYKHIYSIALTALAQEKY